jgi:hypothetical protein
MTDQELMDLAEKKKSGQRKTELARYYALTPEKRAERMTGQRDIKLRRKYGITLAEFDMLDTGRCWMCDTDEAGGRDGTFHVDHDHETGEVRAILCSPCNTGLGQMGDSIEALEQAIRVLKQGPAVIAAKLAEHRETTPFVAPVRREKYDWDLLLNGDEHTLVPGIDFDCTTMGFVRGARKTAAHRGQRLRVRTNEDGSIQLRATNQPVVGSVNPTTEEVQR